MFSGHVCFVHLLMTTHSFFRISKMFFDKLTVEPALESGYCRGSGDISSESVAGPANICLAVNQLIKFSLKHFRCVSCPKIPKNFGSLAIVFKPYFDEIPLYAGSTNIN